MSLHSAKMDLQVASELRMVLEQYDLGKLVWYEKNERGFVNVGFAIETDAARRYFLRKYKRGIKEAEIQFEHSLINHLVAEQFPPVARLYPTRAGLTYLHRLENDQDSEGVFYAIFDYLPGEDRFTWVDPDCTPEELKNAAITLAQFHNATSHFAPQRQRVEPKILDLLPVIIEIVKECPSKDKGTSFDRYLFENLPFILQSLQRTRAILEEPQARKMVQLVIHCDFHPGNLKYEGEQVVGLFDFDWSKVDARCFDVALAIWYFCAVWAGDGDGALRLGQVEMFLGAYQGWLQGRAGVGPLDPQEGKYLPYMINASNLYVMNWTILDYYAKEVDPQEYLIYLRHSVEFSRWFEVQDNFDRLEKIVFGLTG